jgi:hypothetical protein
MENGNLIKIVSIKQKNARSVRLNLQLGNESGSYDVSIVDRNGVFGLELPDALGLKLRRFPPAESRNLVASVKRKMAKTLVPA